MVLLFVVGDSRFCLRYDIGFRTLLEHQDRAISRLASIELGEDEKTKDKENSKGNEDPKILDEYEYCNETGMQSNELTLHKFM